MGNDPASILVADDDPGIRKTLASLLRDEGYLVTAVEHGLQALEAFERNRFDLAILDVVMPYMDGFEVCAAIRKTDEVVPVVFLSAKGDIVDKRVGYAMGANDYISKPFCGEEFLLRVAALIRSGKRAVESGSAFDGGVATFGDLQVDVLRQQVFLKKIA